MPVFIVQIIRRIFLITLLKHTVIKNHIHLTSNKQNVIQECQVTISRGELLTEKCKNVINKLKKNNYSLQHQEGKALLVPCNGNSCSRSHIIPGASEAKVNWQGIKESFLLINYS